MVLREPTSPAARVHAWLPLDALVGRAIDDAGTPVAVSNTSINTGDAIALLDSAEVVVPSRTTRMWVEAKNSAGALKVAAGEGVAAGVPVAAGEGPIVCAGVFVTDIAAVLVWDRVLAGVVVPAGVVDGVKVLLREREELAVFAPVALGVALELAVTDAVPVPGGVLEAVDVRVEVGDAGVRAAS